MKKLDKIQTRLTCMMESISLKQNLTTSKEYENVDVIEIAKDLEKYILGK